jgi:Ran GTPase-activating protein (RanGAP) involved in mRNA processing and transport
MLNQPKSPPLPTGVTKAPQKPTAEAPVDNRMDQLQALLLGNTREEMSDRIDHLGDRFSDFEQYVRSEFRKVAEDLRATERRQEDHRREVLKEISAAMDLMAQNVRRLSE